MVVISLATLRPTQSSCVIRLEMLSGCLGDNSHTLREFSRCMPFYKSYGFDVDVTRPASYLSSILENSSLLFQTNLY